MELRSRPYRPKLLCTVPANQTITINLNSKNWEAKKVKEKFVPFFIKWLNENKRLQNDVYELDSILNAEKSWQGEYEIEIFVNKLHKKGRIQGNLNNKYRETFFLDYHPRSKENEILIKGYNEREESNM